MTRPTRRPPPHFGRARRSPYSVRGGLPSTAGVRPWSCRLACWRNRDPPRAHGPCRLDQWAVGRSTHRRARGPLTVRIRLPPAAGPADRLVARAAVRPGVGVAGVLADDRRVPGVPGVATTAARPALRQGWQAGEPGLPARGA